MATVKRIENGEAYEEKAIPSSATVQYEVLGAYTASGAVAAVKGVVPLGSAHPDGISGDRLKSVRYIPSERISAGDSRGWFVSVEFTLDGSGANFEEPPITEETYATAELAVVKREIEAPYFRKQKVFSRVGTSVVETFRWVEDSQKISLNTLTLRIVVNVGPTEYTLAAFKSIRSKTNKLHVIEGDKWIFNGGSATQVSVDTWRIAYEWWADPGNPALPVPTGSNASDLILPPERPSFTNYFKDLVTVGIPPLTGLTQVPIIRISEPLIDDPNGYVGLPGNPIGSV